MSQIKKKYTFPAIDKNRESYFELPENADPCYEFHFNDIPVLKRLMSIRLDGRFSDAEIMQAVRDVFKNKPRKDRPADDDRKVVDFIYQM